MPAVSGRHSMRKAIRSLPSSTARASAASSGSSTHSFSRLASTPTTVRLATSPAACPPTPSATAASLGVAKAASSLCGRTGPVSVRAAQESASALTAGEATPGRRSRGAVLRGELLALTLGALAALRDALGAARGDPDRVDDGGDGDDRRDDGEEDDHARGTAAGPCRDRTPSVLAGAGLFAADDLALGVHARGDGLVADDDGEGAAGLGAGGEAGVAVEAR